MKIEVKEQLFTPMTDEMHQSLMKEYQKINPDYKVEEGVAHFFRLAGEKFKDWILAFDDITIVPDERDSEVGNVSIVWSIIRVPKEVTEKDISKAVPELDDIMAKIFRRVIETNS